MEIHVDCLDNDVRDIPEIRMVIASAIAAVIGIELLSQFKAVIEKATGKFHYDCIHLHIRSVKIIRKRRKRNLPIGRQMHLEATVMGAHDVTARPLVHNVPTASA